MVCNFFALMMLSSCVKYYEVIKSEVPQGEKLYDNRQITHNYVRSQRVMDQFITRAVFDVLWLSNETRRAYVDTVCRSKPDAERSAMLKRQFEENNHWISFYVLADIRHDVYKSLNDQNSEWRLYLKLSDGKRIEPVSIQEHEIEAEYQQIFGYRFSLHKTGYLVKFSTKSPDGKPFISADDSITLVMASPDRMTNFVWNKNDFKESCELLADEDFYWI